MPEAKIADLEARLAEEEAKIQELFKAGKIPGKTDWFEVDKVKAELKIAKRTKTTAEVAAKKGMTISEYMRFIKKGVSS